MRVRLLIDMTIPDEDVAALAEIIAEQPVVTFTLPEPFGMTGGRFMGAQPVAVETD